MIGLVYHLRQSVGIDIIERREYEISEKVDKLFRSHPNIHVLGFPFEKTKRLPVFTFLIRYSDRYLHFNFVSQLFNDLFGIQTRGGCACAFLNFYFIFYFIWRGPYGAKLLGYDYTAIRELIHILGEDNAPFVLKGGSTRLSLPYFVSDEEINYVVNATLFIASFGHLFLPKYNFDKDSASFTHYSKYHSLRDIKSISSLMISENQSDHTRELISSKQNIDYDEMMKHAFEYTG